VNALVLDAGALIAIDRDDRDVHKTVRDVQPVTPDDGRKAGELLEAAGLYDAIDASVALLWPRPAIGSSPAIGRPPDAVRSGREQGHGGSLLSMTWVTARGRRSARDPGCPGAGVRKSR
jgi:hypothetical protein